MLGRINFVLGKVRELCDALMQFEQNNVFIRRLVEKAFA